MTSSIDRRPPDPQPRTPDPGPDPKPPTMLVFSEQQLIERARRGEQAALGDLLERYRCRLYNVCLRMVGNRDDAAEVTQDAMLKVIEHFHDYNGQAAVSTWMIRICMNLSISHLRKRKLRLTTSLDGDGRPGRGSGGSGGSGGGGDDQMSPLLNVLADGGSLGGPRDGELAPPQSVEQREMVAHLHEAMGRLDEEFRAVLVLRDLQEMDYQDIAAALSIPMGTVKSRLFRARLALRQEMQQRYPMTEVRATDERR
ncbi:MAG: sigma-70 family RNA polymerase sigma factor [Phycisphaeraceae bacterium]